MKNFDSQTWDATSYDSVIEQFDYFTEQLSQPLALRMVSMAEIAPTENVLDIGTGTGVVALQAARMVDSNGMVYGTRPFRRNVGKSGGESKTTGTQPKSEVQPNGCRSLEF